MADTATHTPPSLRRWSLALAIGVPVAWWLRLGQDANWDLRNYHLYNPHAWLHGRLATDIAPAQQQTWHNPLLDLPLYLLADAPGWIAGLWLVLPFVLALACLLRLHAHLLGARASVGGQVALALLATTGAAALSTLGTSLNDAFVAAGVLGAGWWLVRKGAPSDRDWLVAGALLGGVTGLKLTAAPYCLALAVAASVAGPARHAPLRLAWLALGGVLGLALTFAWWGWTVHRLHGSPVFPYFNAWFHSPDAPPKQFADLRFRPASVVDAMAIPLRLLQTSARYSELLLRDPRLLLGLLAGAWLAWRHRRAAATWPLAAFFGAGFALWAGMYGIYRYALPLELLSCLFVVLALDALPRGRLVALALATLAIFHFTLVPDWGREPFGPRFAAVTWPALPPGSLVVTATWEPIAYAAIGLPDDIAWVSARNNFMAPPVCTRLQAQVEQRLRTHPGPIYLLRPLAGDDADREALAPDYGLDIAGACGTVVSNLGALSLCPLRREPRPPFCAGIAAPPGR
jgi:hypothetical protein